MVPHSKRSRHSELKLHRVRSPEWKVGIIKQKGYNITSIERTVVDTIHYRRIVGSTIDKTTLSKVMGIADQLKVLH